MALNIKPASRQDSGHEVADLLYWNIPWVQGLSVLMILIGVQQLLFYFGNPFRLALSMAFLTCAATLYSFVRAERSYVLHEKGSDLEKALSSLGSFWKTYTLVLVFSMSTLLHKQGRDDVAYVVPVFLAIWLLGSRFGVRSPQEEGFNLTKCISKYAAKNLRQTQLVTYCSLGVGLTFTALYIGSFFIKLSMSESTCLIWGVSYVGIGTGAGLYWRKVRDISRNPSVIYFERSLERLNLYWLIFVVFSLLQFLGNFS